jgi:lipid-binding SYLF domain-containing protein
VVAAPGDQRSWTVSFSLTAEIQKAALSLDRIFTRGTVPLDLDRTLPIELIKQAKGLAFLTIVKGGFLITGKIGTGLVVAKKPDGTWSAPSAIGTVGLGWGAQIGGEISDFVGVLMSDDAVEAFSGHGQVSLGAEMGLAVGPVGRAGEATLNFGDRGPASCYSYTTSQGLFAGVSLEGAVIKSRDDVNLRFYGTEHTPLQLLKGDVAQPLAAAVLYKAIDRVFAVQDLAAAATAGEGRGPDDDDPVVSVP